MMQTGLFSSTTNPIPPLRGDVDVITMDHNGRTVLYFHDPLGYATPDFALDSSIEPVLSLLNGTFSVNSLRNYLEKSISEDELLSFIWMLDEARLLESPYSRTYASALEQDFEASGLRSPALSGSSYPEDPQQLSIWLDRILSSAEGEFESKIALFAPHIDTRVGTESYAKAFSSLKKLKPKRVVILATAHYTGYYPGMYDHTPFIGTNKRFVFPHGSIEPDSETLDKLTAEGESIGYTDNDRAHRIEHSIETHLLFARHIWQHDFTIVPILTGSFDELFYMKGGDLAGKISRFAKLLKELHTPDTFYLISGDLCHYGKKFGDTSTASQLHEEVKVFDDTFLKLASANKTDELLSHIGMEHDPYKVCGFPPLFTFLNTFPELKGIPQDYKVWDESARESAVSYGIISF
jgi:AmmeMemoRadiSam system protein B